ncbi:MAG: hypothetical protein IJM11_06505 [Firmicutes bacterium]|nr:hypothetical protein [Bacillota bacterium]
MDTEKAYKAYKDLCEYASREADALETDMQTRVKALNSVIAGADTEFSAGGEEIEKRYRPALKKLDLYYTIAKEHCKLRIEDLSVGAKEPDFSALSRMASSIGKYDYDDPKAADMVWVLAANYNWVRKMRDKELGSARKRDVTAEKQKLQEVDEQYERSRLGLKSDLSWMLKGLKDQAETLRNAYDHSVVTSEDLKTVPVDVERYIPLFSVRRRLSVPRIIEDDVAASLEGAYDRPSSSVQYPHFEGIEGGTRLMVVYKDDAEAVRGEASAVVLNFLKRIPPAQLRITLIDRISYSAALIRDLLPLGSVLDPVPGNENEIEDLLKKLAEEYRNTEESNGRRTVDEVNRSGGSLPYRLLIIHEEENYYGGDQALRYLKENAGALGVTVVTFKRTPKPETAKKEAGCSVMIREAGGGFILEDGSLAALLSSSAKISDEFREALSTSAGTKELSNLMMDHVAFESTGKGRRKRGEVSVPFAIDESGRVIEADFTNTNFAAFMEGAAGSGKSSLLHVIITGLMMRYHPDEMELWLVDFKMTEFGEYAKYRLPHVKCVLLDSSEDLVYDLVDRLIEKLKERMVRFSKANWSSMDDVPADVYMPDIFVIIDEFGDMSNVLHSTAGEGADRDYCEKMEYLLRESRSFGFHFIFSNQAFTEGSQGLTEMAKLQIRNRFALLNERSEIRAILDAGASDDERVQQWIAGIKPFETLFRTKENDGPVIRKYRNLYIPGKERRELLEKISKQYRKTDRFDPGDDGAYLGRDLVMIDGTRPQSFEENNVAMLKKEKDMYLGKGDVPIFAGAPMSFERVERFTLRNFAAENILLAAQDPMHQMAVAKAVMDSWKRYSSSCEVWADPGQSAFESYGEDVFGSVMAYTDLEEICERVEALKKSVKSKRNSQRLVVVLGYERMCTAWELLSDMWDDPEEDDGPKSSTGDILDLMEKASDPGERERLLREHNEMVELSRGASSEGSSVSDARGDIKRLVKLGPIFGLHFMFVIERAAAFQMTGLELSAFSHKLVFPMSKDDAAVLECHRQHPELLRAGTFMYTDGHKAISMRPYITPGVPLYPEWEVGPDGEVRERGV